MSRGLDLAFRLSSFILPPSDLDLCYLPVRLLPDMKKPATLPRRLCAALCLFALVFGFANTPARAQLTEPDFKQWSLLAVQDEGRVKPLDTFARESLLHLTGGSFLGMAIYKDATGKIWHPDDFLLSVLISDKHDWKKEPLVLVNYRPLVQKLGLDIARKRFSFEELTQLPALDGMIRAVDALRAGATDPDLNREQQEVESLNSRLALLHRLLTGESLLVVPRPPRSNADLAALTPQSATAGAQFAASTAWLVPAEDARNLYGLEKFAPVSAALSDTLHAYEAADRYGFQVHARELRDALRALNPTRYPGESLLGLEYNYNHLDAFPWAAGLYGLGAFFLLLAAGGEWVWAKWLGLGAGLGGVLLHGIGMGMRCVVAGRPPVTNMYESMLWVSFVVVVLGFVFYAVYRGTTFLLAALPVGCVLLLLVQQLPVAIPGTIEPLRPVLRDNFWLSTHVLTETASYGAFALAMAFGHLLLIRYLKDPVAARRENVLHYWLYRTMQLGVLLITVGTILGAVWANYSWGRYWGWDPKETWALITLLCYIAAIHGRIAGWWGQFGLAVASVVCFAAVVMAWYGVNFVLKGGLHSYGRGIGGGGFVATLLILDACFLAAAIWRNSQARNAQPPSRQTPQPPVLAGSAR